MSKLKWHTLSAVSMHRAHASRLTAVVDNLFPVVVGSELDVISESGSTFGNSAPTTPAGNPVGGVPTLGPSPLMRNLSGSGLKRLNRVGSNPLSEMNRRSLQQVYTSSSCLPAAAAALSFLLTLQKLQMCKG